MSKSNVSSFRILSGFLLVGVLLAQFNNCSQVGFSPSQVEMSSLKSGVFEFQPGSRVDGILAEDGIPTENLRVENRELAEKNFVKDCSLPVNINGVLMSRKNYERSLALNEAGSDPTQTTVPVEYAVSFGKKEDRLAYWAHRRAILSDSNPGYSVIPVGGKKSAVHISAGQGVHAYYLADHDQAKAQYANGERCFYSTVKINSPLKTMPAAGRYDFIKAIETNASLIHTIHYMHYGFCSNCATSDSEYGEGHYSKTGTPNRLFGAWPHKEVLVATGDSELQFVKLYVADIREGQLGLGNNIFKSEEGKTRGHEEVVDMREIMDLLAIHRNFGRAVRNLSSVYSGEESFAGLAGVPQLLSNLFGSGEGVVLASQYTPIVLDLGAKKLRTSSVSFGTYFNMAALKDESQSGADQYATPHRTAWLGGDLVDVNSLTSVDGRHFKSDFRRVSDDGFLVLPDEDGKIRSSRNLFGDQTEIKGIKYENGFKALQALADKNCSGLSLKDRYLGPWDKVYSELKVWVDNDRNGESTEAEIMSLSDAGVVAMNVCYINHAEETDAFGNGTSMRSAFLKANPGESLSEDEILMRLETGKNSSGDDVDFRLMVDILFQVHEKSVL